MMALLRCARHALVALGQHCYGRLDVPPGQDARLSASQLLPSLRIDDRLAEMDFGEWEGRSWEQIERSHPRSYRAWLAAWPEVAPPGGERLSAFENRVRSWLEERAAFAEIQSSALVGHAGVIRALRVLSSGATWKDALSQSVPYLEWLAVPVAGDPRR